MKMRLLLLRLVIILVAALVGASIGKVGFSDPVTFSVGGGIIAAVVVGIVSLFTPRISKFEKSMPPKKLLGLRIGTCGFMIALCGWLIAVFISRVVGFYFGATGVIIGFIGIGIHWVSMFGK